MTRGGLGDVGTVLTLGRHLFGGEEKKAEGRDGSTKSKDSVGPGGMKRAVDQC